MVDFGQSAGIVSFPDESRRGAIRSVDRSGSPAWDRVGHPTVEERMPLSAAPIAPLSQHTLLVFLLQLAVLLGLALLLGRLAVRFGLPALVGELLTGVLLGPSVLGHVGPDVAGWLLPRNPEQMHLLDGIGQFGVLMLVGVAGAHLDLGGLRRRRATALRVSGFGLVIPLTLGITAGLLAPAALIADGSERATFAGFVAVAMSVTAIPVIAKTLADLKLLHRDIGQLTLTSGMIDDTVGWFGLALVSAMATSGLSAGKVGTAAVHIVLVLLVTVFVARHLVRWALRLAARSPENGPPIATAVVLILLGAAATQWLSLEAVFGAFLTGMLISAAGIDPARLAPLRAVVLSVLAPIFMASAGLRIDLGALADPKILAAALVALAIAIVGKFSGAYLGARTSRMSHWEGIALGAGMNARGVVEVVVAMVGLRLGVLTTDTYTIVVLIAIVTSLMAPPILRYAMARVELTADEQLRHAAHQAWTVGERRVGATRAGDEQP
jgi:Kef-type K+ transport system membrane component KefB